MLTCMYTPAQIHNVQTQTPHIVTHSVNYQKDQKLLQDRGQQKRMDLKMQNLESSFLTRVIVGDTHRDT